MTRLEFSNSDGNRNGLAQFFFCPLAFVFIFSLKNVMWQSRRVTDNCKWSPANFVTELECVTRSELINCHNVMIHFPPDCVTEVACVT